MSLFSQQIMERRRLDNEEVEDSYARLAASVAGTGRTPTFSLDDAAAADDAIGAVLAFYGQTPAEVPDDVTDPMDRIECAIRPTGVMKRPVRLEGAWWRDAIGPYLGRLKDGSPVAIIPHGVRGYGYADPASMKTVVINRRTAEDLEPDALCFYRPLPAKELNVRDIADFMQKSLRGADYAFLLVATLLVTLL
ncbi:MAG: NHLP family bacteriocin export ABC transporter permease/ATPase subunit, partial [Eggerthellaceae bacterium]|nr:NHLP family bacteriocin export ABC transporter permease/ATPase subunit [Eggerthellaceae bacterium]